MRDDTLKFNVTIKADEDTVREIYGTLVAYPVLFDKLAIVLKHTLESAVLTHDFDLELEHNLQIKHQVEPSRVL